MENALGVSGYQSTMLIIVFVILAFGIATLFAALFLPTRWRLPYSMEFVFVGLLLILVWYGDKRSEEIYSAYQAPLEEGGVLESGVATDGEAFDEVYRVLAFQWGFAFINEHDEISRNAAAVQPGAKVLFSVFANDVIHGFNIPAAGITAVFDAGVPPTADGSAGLAGIYRDLAAQGRLPFRVVACHLIKDPPIDDAVRQAVALGAVLDSELVRAGVLKIVGDGTAEGHTAHLLEPYADKPDWYGQSPFSEAQWHRLVAEADAAGLDIHIHALGDRTVRVALDAIEAAIRANPPRDRRHAIAHLQFVDAADLPRFGALGVIAQFSANWFSADPGSVDTTIRRCGTERQAGMYRVRELLDSGATVAFGTDWPAAGWYSTYKPLDAIEVAVTRRLIGSPEAPLLEPADQRLDLAQALHANTLGAARQLRLEHLVGSLQPGKRADLLVLGENLFQVAPHRIAATAVEMTMMNGRFTHGG